MAAFKPLELKVNKEFIKALEDATKALDRLKEFDGTNIIEVNNGSSISR